MRPREKGLTLWLTGLPASGKTTLARILADRLSDRGVPVEVLDADSLREILTPRPTYSREERDWFYSVLVFLAGLLARHGVTVLVAASAHRRAYRETARRGLPPFAEIYVSCPLELCRERDPKSLYLNARKGKILSLPGEQEPYEAPEKPEAVADTARLSPTQAAQAVLDQLQAAGIIEDPGRGATLEP